MAESNVTSKLPQEMISLQIEVDEVAMKLQVISDIWKDLTGLRPYDMSDYRKMSTDELNKEIERLTLRLDDYMAREQARELKAIDLFWEKLDSVVELGAQSRTEALGWLVKEDLNDLQCGWDCEMWLAANYHICGDTKEGLAIIDMIRKLVENLREELRNESE